MKTPQKFFSVLLAVLLFAAVSGMSVLAAPIDYYAQKAAELMKTTPESILEKEKQGQDIGIQLKEAGKLDEFKTVLLDDAKSRLQLKINDGKLTQQQADETLEKLASELGEWDGTGSPFSAHHSKRDGKLKFEGPEIEKIAADVIGISEEVVHAKLKAGKSIGAQLLDAGKLEEFKTSLLDNLKESLRKATDEGGLKQEQADELYAKFETKIKEWNGSGPIFGDEHCKKEKKSE